MKPFFRRLKFLTHSKVQFQLATTLIIWFFVLVTIFAFIFFQNFKLASQRTDGMSIHDQLLTKTLLVEQTKDLAVWYGAIFLAYIVLTWAYVVVFSHRMTGPVYKMTKLLERAAENKEWPGKFTLRNSDAFPQLATAFNHFVEVMKSKSKSKD